MQSANKITNNRKMVLSKLSPMTPTKRRYEIGQNSHINQSVELPFIKNERGVHIHPKGKTAQMLEKYNEKKSAKSQGAYIDSIISQALLQFKDRKVNKIIVATPLAFHINLGKTVYHSSRNSPKDHRCSSQARNENANQRIDMPSDLQQSPLKISAFNKISLFGSPHQGISKRPQLQDYKLLQIKHSKAHRHFRKGGALQKMKKNNESETFRENKRYSPWKSQEDNQDLMS